MALVTAKTLQAATRRLHLSYWRRLYSTIDLPSPGQPSYRGLPASQSDAHKDEQAGEARLDPRAFTHPRMIFVRPWDGIPTMAHAFAIIRDIERRFGKIREFVLLRDPDVPSRTSPFMHATFVETQDADAIPMEGRVIQVVAPKVDAQREGGIGLDDLFVYLDPETKAQSLSREPGAEQGHNVEPPEKGDVMDVKLERTSLRGPLSMPPPPSRLGRGVLNNPMRMRELAEAITAFGGFVDGDDHGSKPRMQAIVSRWSRVLRPHSRAENAEEAVERNTTDAMSVPHADSGSNRDIVESVSSDPLEHNPTASEEENKTAAQNWWKFLNSGKG